MSKTWIKTKKYWRNTNIKIQKNNDNKSFFCSIIMLRFGEIKVAKEEDYGAKAAINIWNVNANNIGILKLIENAEQL